MGRFSCPSQVSGSGMCTGEVSLGNACKSPSMLGIHGLEVDFILVISRDQCTKMEFPNTLPYNSKLLTSDTKKWIPLSYALKRQLLFLHISTLRALLSPTGTKDNHLAF